MQGEVEELGESKSNIPGEGETGRGKQLERVGEGEERVEGVTEGKEAT